MKKEIYLYSGIYDYSAERIVEALNENSDEDVVMRVNSPGGSVFSGWGIVAKMQERNGKVNVKVDGIAASMAAVVLLFADNVEALDVSTIMLHRAAGYVSNPDQQAFLDRINKDLRSKLEAKIDPKKFEEVTGKKISDLFDKEERIDLFLTAKQAKQIGLVDKIVKADPDYVKAIDDTFYSFAAELINPKNSNSIQSNSEVMTKEDFKLKHPEAYNALVQDIQKQTLTAESDRVGAWMVFIDVDKKAVQEGIASGKAISATQMADFVMKKTSAANLATLEKEGKETDGANPSATVVASEEKGKGAEKTEIEKKEAEVFALLGIEKK